MAFDVGVRNCGHLVIRVMIHCQVWKWHSFVVQPNATGLSLARYNIFDLPAMSQEMRHFPSCFEIESEDGVDFTAGRYHNAGWAPIIMLGFGNIRSNSLPGRRR